MSPLDKIEFACKLLKEVEEEVLSHTGSPPFPELERITDTAGELSDYLSDQGD